MSTTAETLMRITAAPNAAAGGAPRTPGEFFLSVRARNHLLDAVFYDVSVLSDEAIDVLHALRGAEGGLLVVTPDKSSPISIKPTPAEFLAMPARPRVLAVAGVGSSAIGTAAFARNVAEALGQPVAGVVSGYGMRDLLAEALGGWFWFRTRNILFHDSSAIAHASIDRLDSLSALRDAFSPDTSALVQLFEADEPAFDVIVGHSKGNLSISEALYVALKTAPTAARRLLEQAHIITLSAAIYMPEESRRVTDVIGELDWFGKANSHPDLKFDHVLPGAWHHTNTQLDYALGVGEALRLATGRS